MSIKPNYYNKNGFDVIDYIVSSQGKDSAIEFCRGNVIKYITRFDKKNGHEDLVKAQTYINRIMEIKYEKVTDSTKRNKNFVEPENGIRVKDGYNLYKCSYKCECGNIGKRYIKEDADKTSCHKCDKKLEVYPATVNDAHDDDFNYFLAY